MMWDKVAGDVWGAPTVPCWIDIILSIAITCLDVTDVALVPPVIGISKKPALRIVFVLLIINC